MKQNVPDVISDSVTDACRRLNGIDPHAFFLRAAHENRDNDAHGSAQTAFFIWAREGYAALPAYIKDYALRVCDGEFNP